MTQALARVLPAIVEIALGDDAKGAHGGEHPAFGPVDLVHAVALPYGPALTSPRQVEASREHVTRVTIVRLIDKERLQGDVGQGRRFPFGLPRADNGNYIWIELFYSALSERGRAGFVMANSAGDARSSELEIRRQLVQEHTVDVVVAVGPNMFYTVALPCTLWFLDRAKRDTHRADKVLFLDARHIYRQVDRAHREWTEDQVGFLANIVRLYRGEPLDFTFGGEHADAKIRNQFGAVPEYRDVAGLCFAASVEQMAAQEWSLNPGRYVGFAPGEELTDQDFTVRLEALIDEWDVLTERARELENTVTLNIDRLLGTE